MQGLSGMNVQSGNALREGAVNGLEAFWERGLEGEKR